MNQKYQYSKYRKIFWFSCLNIFSIIHLKFWLSCLYIVIQDFFFQSNLFTTNDLRRWDIHRNVSYLKESKSVYFTILQIIKDVQEHLKLTTNSNKKVYLQVKVRIKDETSRSSRPEVFCKKDVLKNFAIFTGKHLCHSLFLIKLQAWGLQLY